MAEFEMDLETAYAKLYMDAELHHSSGYFRNGATSLASAQLTKVNHILTRLELRPGMKMLDVGCGWGATARAAAVKYQVDVVGITLSDTQVAYAKECLRVLPKGLASVDFRCQPWEDFDERVDRIVCVNAFENFCDKQEFLRRCHAWLRPGGMMIILTVTADRPLFRVVSKTQVIEWAREAGFAVESSPSMATDYANTLDCYVQNLGNHVNEVLSLVGQERFDSSVAFYSNCAEFLRSGLNDMFEFTFRRA